MLNIDNFNDDELKNYISSLKQNYKPNPTTFSVDPVTFKPTVDIDDLKEKVFSRINIETLSIPIQELSNIKLVYHAYGKSSRVDKLKSLNEILTIIKKGDSNLSKLLRIRNLGKSHPDFASKKMELPTVRWNFLFNDSVINDNIIAPTGVIYIDVDGCDSIDTKNPLIMSTWKSLSETGFGILVKVVGLTKDNFSDTYNAISNQLGLVSDKGARKPIQPNILSFDPNIYINYDSIVFTAIQNPPSTPKQYEIEKGQSTRINNNQNLPSTPIQYNDNNIDIAYFDNGIVSIISINDIAPQGLKKRERLIGVDGGFPKSTKLRFNNISHYFTGENKDKDYIVFDKKQWICNPYIPKNIPNGKRNVTMFFILSQIALLNQESNLKTLVALANTINKNFIEKYPEDKIIGIVKAIIKKRENNTLELFFNEERLILFNPDKKLLKAYKNKIIGQVMGKRKTDKTQSDLYIIIEQWDFVSYGEINQTKVVEQSGKSLRTIQRHWSMVKDLVKSMNADYINGIVNYNNSTLIDEPIQQEIVAPEPNIEAIRILTPDEEIELMNENIKKFEQLKKAATPTKKKKIEIISEETEEKTEEDIWDILLKKYEKK